MLAERRLAPAWSQSQFQPGGEMERIRHAAREDHLAQVKEAEARRPEYLQRSTAPSDGDKPVGITETPMRGRRLKLFQETSEESFEESLMAGGYGRYVSSSCSTWWRYALIQHPFPLLPSLIGGGLWGRWGGGGGGGGRKLSHCSCFPSL